MSRRYRITAMLATWLGIIMVFSDVQAGAEGDWIQLFNGKDLEGWQPKFRGCKAGENYKSTFRVENSILRVCYDNYKNFDKRFGHLFYEREFSSYILRAEYRFVADQCPGGPGWAFRNNGIMIHGQTPDTMDVDQNFPASIEVQLLGGKGTGERSTGNLCTPDTHVVKDGKLIKKHVVKSNSKTFHGDQWVTIEVEVHGNERIIHRVNGKAVLTYTKPQLSNKKLIDANDGEAMLSGGTISLQAESHPCEFRKVELKILDE